MFTAPRPIFPRKERHTLNGEENCGFRMANFELAFNFPGASPEHFPEHLSLIDTLDDKFASRNPQFEISNA